MVAVVARAPLAATAHAEAGQLAVGQVLAGQGAGRLQRVCSGRLSGSRGQLALRAQQHPPAIFGNRPNPVDRPVALEWAQDVIKPFVEAERKAGVADSSTRYLLFQDNLDAQKQPAYIEYLKDWCVDDHKLPPNETDQVQPIDRGLGRQVKIYLGQQVRHELVAACSAV